MTWAPPVPAGDSLPPPAGTPAPASAGARRAVLTVIGSSVCFATSNVAAKWLTTWLGGHQVAICRTFGALVLCLFVLRFWIHEPRPARPGPLAWRGLLGGTSVLLYFSALGHIPVGVATLFNHLSPVLVVLLAMLVLRERPRPTTLVAVVMVVVGVLMVLSPPGRSSLFPSVGLYESLALASALTSAVAVVLLRDLRRDHGALTLSASFFAGSALFCLLPAIWHWRPPTPLQWAVLAVVALGNFGGQTLFAQALAALPASEASLLSQLSVLITFGGGYLLLGERIGSLGTVGALAAIAGIGWVAFNAAPPSPR